MRLRKDKIMHGIYTVTLNIKALLGLKIRGGGGGRGKRGKRAWERLIQRKKKEVAKKRKMSRTHPAKIYCRIPASGAVHSPSL